MQTTVDVQIKRTSSNIVASCSLPVNEEVHYQISNSQGTVVFSKSIILIHSASKMPEELDVSHLPNGDYLLNIYTDKKQIKKISINI